MAKRRQPKRGGKRAGAGRPRTTGTGSARPISFKVTDDTRARAEALAQERGLSGANELAKLALLDVVAAKF